MEKAYLGNKEVKGCFLGDVNVTESFLGSVGICSMVIPITRFQMKITSPTVPGYKISGGTVTTTNNRDGTWTLRSNDAITAIESINKTDVEIIIESALDLVDINIAWWGCKDLISFDASGLTAVTNADQAWYGCTGLTSFDTAGLTSVTNAHSAWQNCTGLTAFDTSGLINVTNAPMAWRGCRNLVCFNGLDSTGFTDINGRSNMFANCTSLIAPNITEQTDLLDNDGAVYVNANACPPHIFKIKIISPTRPGFSSVGGGHITVDDNQDGSWTAWSDDPITKFRMGSNKTDITEVIISLVDTVIDYTNTWSDCTGLTGFDTSKMTSAEWIVSTWSNCTGLTSFDTSGLTLATRVNNTWEGCTGLTSFDTVGLISAASAYNAWSRCSGLISFDASGLTKAKGIQNAWQLCTNLASFDASPLVTAELADHAWNECTNMTFFNGSGIRKLRSINGLFHNCEKLVCISALYTGTSPRAWLIFEGCTSLVEPGLSMQAELESGFDYVNTTPCPALAIEAYVIGGSLMHAPTISPFKLVDGNTENTYMQGVDFLDGTERTIVFKYQYGLTDTNVGLNALFSLATSWNHNYTGSPHIAPMYNIADSRIKGEWVQQLVAAGTEIRIKYDTAKNRLYADWS